MRQLFISLFILGLSGCVTVMPQQDLTQISDQESQRFVETVLVGTEYQGGDRVHRWKGDFTVSVAGGTAEDEATVSDIVADLNGLLEGTGTRLHVIAPLRQADMRVIFAPQREFSSIAAQEDFKYVPGHPGFFSIWWDFRGEIYWAVILIDTGLRGNKRKHMLREEMTQAMGLANDSSQIKSSIFYEKGKDGGYAVDYNEMDRKLIRFFYRHVPPGSNREQIRRAYHQHWSTS